MKPRVIDLLLLMVVASIICTAPWWWQRLAALPLATATLWLIRNRAVSNSLIEFLELVPYLEPVRGSRRTGQLVYQFVRSHSTGDFVTTTLEQLIASFLQIGLAKVDTRLSPPTQQLITSAVPTLVSAIAAVIVDLAENHKTTKAATVK
ncbi:MAG: hypothetical protein JO353_12920 [Phycisphaerae bacterium]|nr:hypothetical protein [Phycisphaerae bacterium]